MREVNPDEAAALIKIAADAAEAVRLTAPPPGETPAARARRLVTHAVLHLIEQGLLVIPDDLARRLARPIPPDRDAARRLEALGWTDDPGDRPAPE
jgi:hypothetical protein